MILLNKNIKQILVCFIIFVIFLSAYIIQCEDGIQASVEQNNKIQQKINHKQQKLVESNIHSKNNPQNIYTQNITQFKSTKYNQRLQSVVGCWLMVQQFLSQKKSNNLFNNNSKMKKQIMLILVKQCMKNIGRKDAILKITSLVGKNISQPKKYQDLVKDKSKIDQLFIHVTNKYIITAFNYNQQPMYQNQFFQTDLQLKQNRNNIFESKQIEQISSQEQKIQISNQLNNKQIKNVYNLSEFDLFLLELLREYQIDLNQLKSSKEGIKGRVQQQLKKRQKYYFGFIPATQFTHSLFLVTLSLSMVFFCTCYKYYKMRKTKKKKNGINEEQQIPSPIIKNNKNLKMSQITKIKMRKKLK